MDNLRQPSGLATDVTEEALEWRCGRCLRFRPRIHSHAAGDGSETAVPVLRGCFSPPLPSVQGAVLCRNACVIRFRVRCASTLDAGGSMSLVRNQTVWKFMMDSTTRFICALKAAHGKENLLAIRLNAASHAGSDTSEDFAAARAWHLTATPNEKRANLPDRPLSRPGLHLIQ